MSDMYPTVLICHALPVSDFLILIKSCSTESRNDPIPKSEVVHKTKFSLKNHVWLAQLYKHQTSKLRNLFKPLDVNFV